MENAPFFEDIADGPAGGVAHWVTASDGLKIRVGHWTGPQMKGTILLFPGRTEYIEKYGPAAADFAARGYGVAAIDWRGQGIADRTTDTPTLGDVEDFKDYQKDVIAALAHMRNLACPSPIILWPIRWGAASGFGR